jgi:hypothetical protein
MAVYLNLDFYEKRNTLDVPPYFISGMSGHLKGTISLW